MCTLIFAYHVVPNTPLLVAANRDEKYQRQASPPRLIDAFDIPILAPIDEQAGGSWLGINAYGLVVGITNQFGAPSDPLRASRGELVMEALSERTAERAAQRVAELGHDRYNGFHLLIADTHDAFIVWNSSCALHVRPLKAGIYSITERGFDPEGNERIKRIERHLECLRDYRVDSFQHLLSTHAKPSFDGLCVHLPEMGYGTRSSTVIAPWPESVFLHANGSPCTTSYEDFSGVLESLLK